ncbi:hypothetical protein ABW636_09670 [Aquimarina sp. 2201CG1-2-11]|uniref:hypothetical protein n=1 Tax=Aquimarina discodermiae TaxID=3231043 RepID=UPI00346287DB
MQAQENNTTITDNSYIINESPKDFYTGIYKDDKPYNGYFKKENVEFFTVDYYEKGIKKYNYSSDVLQMLTNNFDDHNRLKLNIKSIYKDDYIFSGVKYNYSKNKIIGEQFDNGQYKGFYIDFFGVHYYNRITVVLNQEEFEIESLQDKDAVIKVFLKNNLITAELQQMDTVLVRAQNVSHNESVFPSNSTIRLYKENEIFKGSSYQVLDESNYSLYEEHQELFNIFSKLDIYSVNTTLEVFTKFLKDNKEEPEVTKNQIQPVSFILLGYLITNDNGYPKEGIRFFENLGNGYYVSIEEGKISEKKKVQIKEFQNIIKSYLEEKYDR